MKQIKKLLLLTLDFLLKMINDMKNGKRSNTKYHAVLHDKSFVMFRFRNSLILLFCVLMILLSILREWSSTKGVNRILVKCNLIKKMEDFSSETSPGDNFIFVLLQLTFGHKDWVKQNVFENKRTCVLTYVIAFEGLTSF